ncbi:MAG: hypothetical protein M5U09_28045 [Gammaproteobacteria bacterium]|nr:hypothetical protein [Gammaproteobacteria bacterium]
MSVAVFEKRDESGTFCSTEEVMHPGVKVNMHASLLLAHFGPAYVDLELERFGFGTAAAAGCEVRVFLPVPGRQCSTVFRARRAGDLRGLGQNFTEGCRDLPFDRQLFRPDDAGHRPCGSRQQADRRELPRAP